MKHLKRLAVLALFLLVPLVALATPPNKVQGGFRLLNGDTINQIIDVLNGQSSGTFAGVFNGTVGATTPSTGVFTTATTARFAGSGTAPTLGTCGTSPSISGTDLAGTVTMGTGSPTGCVITFSSTYTTAPHCVVTWRTNIASMQYVVAATTITLTQTGTSSNLVDYVCVK